MKQTNGAVTLLLSAFRSIYRNAYVKGIASAVVLTAGLGAGSAQAVEVDPYYWTADSYSWTTETQGKSKVSNDTRVAGNIEESLKSDSTLEESTHSVSGGSLTIGAIFEQSSPEQTATGAQLRNVSGSAYGVYISESYSGGVSATGGILNIIRWASITGNAVGGWAKNTGDGTATASGNQVHLNGSGTITLGAGSQIIGAWASSKNGATADNNHVIISGAEDTNTLVIKNTAFGGMAIADDGATQGDYLAEGNSVSIQDASLSGGKANIYGGYVKNWTNSGAATSFTARDNQITVSNVITDENSTSTNQIAANFVQNQSGASANSGADSLTVAGSEDKISTYILNSNLKKETIYGGFISDNGSAHSVSATHNSVLVENSTLSGSAVYGAFYEQLGSPAATQDTQITITATGNSVEFNDIASAEDAKTHTATSVMGAEIKAADVTGNEFVTINASDNSVKIGSNQTFSGNGMIVGAAVEAATGVKASLSNNSVIFDGDYQGTDESGYIAGAVLSSVNNGEQAPYGDLTGNSVTITGKVTKASIYGALDGSSYAPESPSNLSHNSVVIGDGAEINQANIYAVHNIVGIADTSFNTVTVEDGAKVINSNIYGGAGSDSAITLSAGSEYSLNGDVQTDRVLRSDIINVEGTVSVTGSEKVLTFSGFYTDGDESASTYRTNLTNIKAGAVIENGATIKFLGHTVVDNDATMVATQSDASIVVATDDTIAPPENAVGGAGILTISTDKLHSYLEAAATQDAENPDLAGNVLLKDKSVLDLTDDDTVILNQDVQSSADNAGRVSIDSFATYATVKAHDIAITGEMTNVFGHDSGDKLIAEGDIVTLGNSNYQDTDSDNKNGWRSLGLKQVTVHDELNLVANANQTFRTNGTDLYFSRDTAGSGSLNDAIEVSSSDKMTVGRGAFVADGNITLSDGSLVVGQSGEGDSDYDTVNGETSSLTFKNTTLKLTSGSDSVEVGNASADNRATLDLSSGQIDTASLTDTSASNVVTAKVNTNGTLILNADQAQSLLTTAAAVDDGLAVSLENDSSKIAAANGRQQATLLVKGNLDDVNFNRLTAKDGTTETAGTVNFKNSGNISGGIFEVEGSLGLVTGTAGTINANGTFVPGTAATVLDIGSGTIKADTVTLTNLNTVRSGDGMVPAAQVQVKNANIQTNNLGSTVDGQTVVLGADNGTAKVSLGLAQSGNTGSLLSSVEVASATSTLGFKTGEWDLGGNDITVTKGSVVADAGASLTSGGELSVGNGASFNLASDDDKEIASTADFAEITTVNGANVTINNGAELNISGVAATETDKSHGLSIADRTVTVNGTLSFGEEAVQGIISDNKVTENVGVLTTTTGSRVNFAFDDSVNFDADLATSFKEQLFGGVDMKGVADVGNAQMSGLTNAIGDDLTLSYTEYRPFAGLYSGLINNTLRQTTLTVDASENALGVEFTGGRVQGTGTVTSVSFADTTNLTGIDGQYVIDENGKNLAFNVGSGVDVTLTNDSWTDAAIADVTFTDAGSSLVLNGSNGFTVASVGTDATKGSVTVDTSVGFTGNIEVSDLSVNDALSYVGEAANTGAVEVTDVFIDNGGSLTAKSLTIGRNGELFGDVNVENLTVNGSANIEEGATTTVSNVMTIENGATVTVGYDGDNAEGLNSAPGYLFAQELKLEGNLVIDPAYNAGTAFVAIGRFDGASTDYTAKGDIDTFDGGVQSGNILVGMNSVMGVGATLDELKAAVAPYQVNGNLSDADGSYGAILYLNKQIEVGDGNGIVLQATKVADENHDGYADSDGTTAIYGGPNQTWEDGVTYKTEGYYAVQGNTFIMGDNTALILTRNAFGKDLTGTAITFQNADSSVVNEGGTVVLAAETGVFKDGTELSVFDDASADGKIAIDNDILVTTSNKLLTGTISAEEDTGDVVLGVDREASRGILNAASSPVYSTLMAYAIGYNDWHAETPEDALYNGYTEESVKAHAADPSQPLVKNTEYGNALLTNEVNSGNGSAAEAAARMAVYGGAVEAALVAGQTTSDAIASRMGMGNPSSVLTYADNADGAGIWLAPVYRNHESDGFDAQGVDYGADLDLYGVALGVDYTFAQGFRAGVMFNIGSGDADGQGAGSSVSNDFDYWGVGVYGGYAYENFSITADLGYTVVDNDLDASSGYADIGSMEASTDTESLSLGLTAQYKFALDALDITPHVGARFTRIDMDDYSVNSKAGTLAEFSADSMNVFSVPVGVSFSKDIVSGDWSVQPALDLVVTANTGDDEFDGDVAWSGVSNLTTATSTEVLDSFTYGANLGVSVKNVSGLSLGLGVNYTGSDNTDEFGAQASVRYAF